MKPNCEPKAVDIIRLAREATNAYMKFKVKYEKIVIDPEAILKSITNSSIMINNIK
jgi:hypothetical protein